MAYPQVDVRFPAQARQPSRCISLRVIQKVYKHDVAVIKYFRENHNQNRYRNGSPVEIEWGYFPKALELFVGQVHHTETHIENNRHVLYVMCIGASYPMDEEVGVSVTVPATNPTDGGDASTPTYDPLDPTSDPNDNSDAMDPDFAASLTGRTPSQIACAIADDQDFDIVRDEPDPSEDLTPDEAPQTWASPGESKWEFQVRLAMKNGFIFYVNGTTMYYYDPVTFLDKRRQTFPLINIDSRRVAKYAPVEKFTLLHSDDGNTGAHGKDPHLKQDNRRHIVRGVDPRTHRSISKTGKLPTSTLAGKSNLPRFSRTHHDEPVHSVGEAKQRANAHQRQNRWKYHAKVTARGNARIHQGSGVIIRGVNKNDDGVWMVLGVEHDLTLEPNHRYNYAVHCDLARDTTARKGQAPGKVQTGRSERPLLTADQRKGKQSSKSVYVRGKWKSSFKRETVLGKSSE